MSTDRTADGYEPRFDIDFAYGAEGEAWVAAVGRGAGNGKTQVKRDARALDTGNLYVEYACRRRDGWAPSGIRDPKSEAESWVFVLGDSGFAVVVAIDVLRRIADVCRAQGRLAEERDGECPTKGVLIPLRHLFAHARGAAA